MNKLILTKSLSLLAITLLLNNPSFGQQDAIGQLQLNQASGALKFMENKGQLFDTDGNQRNDIPFYMKMPGTIAYFLENSISFSIIDIEKSNAASELMEEYDYNLPENVDFEVPGHRIDMEFVGANPSPNRVSNKVRKEYYNLYNSPLSYGLDNVKAYDELVYEELYTGIDLKCYVSKEHRLEYDYVVKPHADPNQILINYAGADYIKTSKTDNRLIIGTNVGEVNELMPEVYQNINNTKKIINAKYVLNAKNQVSIKMLEQYDPNYELIIDPYWITYLGGPQQDYAHDIDEYNGKFYIAATSFSLRTTYPSGIGPFTNSKASGSSTDRDGIIVSFNEDGTANWFTYIGGSGVSGDYFTNLTMDGSGNIYGCGATGNLTIPGFTGSNPASSGYNTLVYKMSNAGSLTWGKFRTGTTNFRNDYFMAIAYNAVDDEVMCGGTTNDATFPLSGSIQSTQTGTQYEPIFAIYDNNGNLVRSSYIGGTNGWFDTDYISDIVCVAGNYYVGGNTHAASTDFFSNVDGGHPAITPIVAHHANGYVDCFLYKYNPNTNRIEWATFCGGQYWDNLGAMITDGTHLYLGGKTISDDFNLGASPGYMTASVEPLAGDDGFVAKYDLNGTQVAGTYVGALGNEYIMGMKIYNGELYVQGQSWTNAGNSATAGTFQVTQAGSLDHFVSVMSTDLQTNYRNTYIGGTSSDGNQEDYLAGNTLTALNGYVYLTGTSNSNDYPTGGTTYQAASGGGTDMVISKICAATLGTPGDGDCVLPIELIQFSGKAIDNKFVALNWSTISEENSSHFDIERSLDGNKFEVVGFLNAAGNSQALLHYSYIDNDNLPAGQSLYYRLKQVDLDGYIDYSNTIEVKLYKDINQTINVYPNPAQQYESIVIDHLYASKMGNTSIQVIDVTGKQVKQFNVTVKQGDNSIRLSTEGLTPGIYMLRVYHEEEMLNQKLIIE